MNIFKPERIVKHFFEELENGKITGRKCKKCGVIEYPPVLVCNECGNDEMEWVEMSRTANLREFVVMSPLSARPGFESIMPYGMGIIDVEGVAVGRNFIIQGISPANQNELRAKVEAGEPIPVEAKIIQRGNYKTVVYSLI